MRSACTVPKGIVAQFLKGHVKSLEDGAYSQDSLEDVVASYKDLLVSFASTTERMNAGLIIAAATEVFGGPPAQLRHFGQRLAEAFAYCRRKARSMSSGAKLSPAVRAVTAAMSQRSSPKKVLPVASGGTSAASSSADLSPVATAMECPRELPKCKRQKSTLDMRTSEIYALYGCAAPPVPPPQPRAEPVNVLSSQEVLSSQDTQDPLDEMDVGRTSGSPPKGAGSPLCTFVDHAKMCCVRVSSAGREEAVLTEGEDGFAQAVFGSEVVQTEVPNILVALANKQSDPQVIGRRLNRKTRSSQSAGLTGNGGGVVPSAGVPPGLASGSDAIVPALTADTTASACPAEPHRRYLKMWYKLSHMFGIRQKFGGKKQVFAIGGKMCGLTMQELSGIADEAIQKLHAGSSEEAAKTWARSEVSSRGPA